MLKISGLCHDSSLSELGEFWQREPKEKKEYFSKFYSKNLIK